MLFADLLVLYCLGIALWTTLFLFSNFVVYCVCTFDRTQTVIMFRRVCKMWTMMYGDVVVVDVSMATAQFCTCETIAVHSPYRWWAHCAMPILETKNILHLIAWRRQSADAFLLDMWDYRQRARRTRRDLQFIHIYWFYRTIDGRATTLHLYIYGPVWRTGCTAGRRPLHTRTHDCDKVPLTFRQSRQQERCFSYVCWVSSWVLFRFFLCNFLLHISRERGRIKCAGEWNIAIFVSFYPFSECIASTSNSCQ